MKRVYFVLATAGFALPYYFFVRFLLDHGLDIPLALDRLFSNDISTFFTVDLAISAIAFLVFSYREAANRAMHRWWIYLAATLVVGPSFSLPLFLYVRETHLSETEPTSR